jgi:hypothetical protein
MSDTPETDHIEDQLGSAAKFSHPIIWKHARQLERERNEAREDLEFRRGLYKVQEECLEKARKERDEWAAMCGRYKQERDEAMKKYDALATEHMLVVNKLCKERDEARDQLIHLRSCVYDVIHSLKAGAFDELEKAWKEGLK